MEEDLMKNEVKENLEKTVRVVQRNNFIYTGKIINFDEKSLKILDFRSNHYHTIKFDWLEHLEILE